MRRPNSTDNYKPKPVLKEKDMAATYYFVFVYLYVEREIYVHDI